MEIYARQGDLVIVKLDEISGELSKARDIVFAGDSSGHRHRLMGVCLMRRDGAITRFSIAEPTQIIHEKPDGHNSTPMEVGAYEVRPLRERGDGLDRQVED